MIYAVISLAPGRPAYLTISSKDDAIVDMIRIFLRDSTLVKGDADSARYCISQETNHANKLLGKSGEHERGPAEVP